MQIGRQYPKAMNDEVHPNRTPVSERDGNWNTWKMEDGVYFKTNQAFNTTGNWRPFEVDAFVH